MRVGERRARHLDSRKQVSSAPEKDLPGWDLTLAHLPNYSGDGARELLLRAAIVFMPGSFIMRAPPPGWHGGTERERQTLNCTPHPCKGNGPLPRGLRAPMRGGPECPPFPPHMIIQTFLSVPSHRVLGCRPRGALWCLPLYPEAVQWEAGYKAQEGLG